MRGAGRTGSGSSPATGSARARVAIVAALALALLTSCGEPERTVDLSGSEAISFDGPDGVRLEGRVFGEGATAVVLSHMRPADQRSWFDLAVRLADSGYLVLTYNFRGYCPGGPDGGCSEGQTDIGALWRDVRGAIGFVRSRGATSVALVGASMGGTASIVAASGADVVAVITLSAPASIDGLVVDADVLAEVRAAKLFIAGVGDAPYAADAEALFTIAPQPKRVEILPSDDHGTDLLSGGQGEVVRRLIEDHLERFASA